MAQTRREAAVAGLRVSSIVVVLLLCNAGLAAAQGAGALFTGFLTAHFGAARAGDVRNPTATGGVSLAVVDASGLGAEIDIGHTGAFDRDFFSDSSVTSFMLNFVGLYPHETVRPFVNVGVGALHVRTALLPGATPDGRTEAAWNAGGGVLLGITDFLGVRGDVRYFRLFDRPEDLVLRDSGFFDYWRISIGATFAWPMR
jgi:hypothetical protein